MPSGRLVPAARTVRAPVARLGVPRGTAASTCGSLPHLPRLRLQGLLAHVALLALETPEARIAPEASRVLEAGRTIHVALLALPEIDDLRPALRQVLGQLAGREHDGDQGVCRHGRASRSSTTRPIASTAIAMATSSRFSSPMPRRSDGWSTASRAFSTWASASRSASRAVIGDRAPR